MSKRNRAAGHSSVSDMYNVVRDTDIAVKSTSPLSPFKAANTVQPKNYLFSDGFTDFIPSNVYIRTVLEIIFSWNMKIPKFCIKLYFLLKTDEDLAEGWTWSFWCSQSCHI
jgi:hypothetical protein